jgi:aryl sulfotransferase
VTAPAGLIWLASYPKSGNTWFRIFLANLAAGDTGPAGINDLGRYGGFAGNRSDFEAATMLESGLLSDDDIDALRPRVYERIAQDVAAPRWMKVHDAYTFLPGSEPLLGRGARAAIYLVRDPRDVAISLAHHNNTTIDAAIALMNRTDSALCDGRMGPEAQLRQKLLDWSGHAASWLDQRDIRVHLIRYEDLKADAATQFGRALAFAGYDADRAEIEQAVRHADFSALQRREREEGFAERKPGAKPFFRAGRAGEWREILTPEQRTRMEDAHAAMMDRLGYARA